MPGNACLVASICKMPTAHNWGQRKAAQSLLQMASISSHAHAQNTLHPFRACRAPMVASQACSRIHMLQHIHSCVLRLRFPAGVSTTPAQTLLAANACAGLYIRCNAQSSLLPHTRLPKILEMYLAKAVRPCFTGLVAASPVAQHQLCWKISTRYDCDDAAEDTQARTLCWPFSARRKQDPLVDPPRTSPALWPACFWVLICCCMQHSFRVPSPVSIDTSKSTSSNCGPALLKPTS